MIELRVQQFRGIPSVDPTSTPELMLKLGQAIDKEKFYGSINIKCENGKIVYCSLNQNFTADSLLDLLSK
jgi:hypothetical protein